MVKLTNFKGLGERYIGKVRDCYITDSVRVLVTTDRISAFDHVLGFIPYKGEVLNLLSQFWFDQTKKIIPNHMISVPHANVMVAKNVAPIPLEIVIRGYITGVTNTSVWGSYEKGERVIYGIKFPNGLRKNQKLPKPIITPTTKASEGHDERITKKEIIERKLVSRKLWNEVEKTAIKLFAKGTSVCAKGGIILVDTKYEFGLDEEGKLVLIDEIHTPDSSRFWIMKTYKERFKKGLEPENFDKEFLRLWYADRGYKGEGKPPKMTKDLATQVSKRYVSIYQKITGRRFAPGKEKLTAAVIRKAFN
jgi:phosphoribosylaminoimidazole-succinocarboxamide synthase